MSYLRFDKAPMTNLEEALQREILRTNRSGAYSCSTVVDCNTRKYHGLLVVPIPELDDENHVLLSSLDVTVLQHGAEFNLALHKYKGGHFSPQGHKYIREFNCDKVPTTTYRVGGVILKREIVFQHYEDRILIRYTLDEAHSPTTLRLRPFLAFRSVRELTHINPHASQEYKTIAGGISTRMYEGYPYLYMQLSKRNEFISKPDWYRDFEYPKETERGHDSNEDLYTPGYFETTIRKGESIVFAASTSESKTRSLLKLFTDEINDRTPRDSFERCLRNAAHQFHRREPNDDRYLLAGYPWFKTRARDTFIALPGLTLAIGETKYFEYVMQTAERGLREFMNRKPLTAKIYEIEQPDVMLWAVWAIQQYAAEEGIDKCHEQYGQLVEDILQFICEGRHPNLFLEDNGLLRTEGRNRAVTWMNSTIAGRPVVPRTGYIVEFNALWFNALSFALELKKHEQQTATNSQQASVHKPYTFNTDKIQELISRCHQSFAATFYNQYGYLFDYVGGEMQNWSVRPNMIFACAFDYSPLTREQKRSVIDFTTRELLTPKGLRSLSPKSCGYKPLYIGRQEERDLAYHQGTAWPWLGGFYLEACLKLYKRSRLSFVERQMVGYDDEMYYHCLGTISELFDGNPPFRGRGAISFAINVAEILRTKHLLEKIRKKEVVGNDALNKDDVLQKEGRGA